MLRILGRPTSINVRKVIWSAAEIGIDFYIEDQWAATASVKSPEFLALNPNGLVPVIEDENGFLWESNTICRYLAAAHNREDLLPVEPFARANVEKWMDWQAGDLNSAWRNAFMCLVRQDPAFNDARNVEQSTKQWNALMELLDAQLSDQRDYVTGDQFSLADVGLGLAVQRWKLTPIARPETIYVDAYAKRLADRTAAKRWIATDIP
jgi:glutathione S-transferase